MKRWFVTIALMCVMASAVYAGWEAYWTFDGISHNGTNRDDDDAATVWGLISFVCVATFLVSGVVIGEMWAKPQLEKGGSS